MGYRKQLTSSSTSFLIISSEHHARDNTKQTALTAQLPPYLTAFPSRSSSFFPPPSPSPLSKSGARRHGKQATKTPDDAKPLPSASSHPPAPRTDRQGQAIARHGDWNRHETPHIDTGTDSKQARRDARRHQLPAPHSEQARSGTGQDGRHRPHSSPTSTGKQATTPAAAPPHRRDKRDGGTGRQPHRRNETTSGKK